MMFLFLHLVLLLLLSILASAVDAQLQLPKYDNVNAFCLHNPSLSDLYIEAAIYRRIHKPVDRKFCDNRYMDLIHKHHHISDVLLPSPPPRPPAAVLGLRPLSGEISQWETFLSKHQKTYASPSEEARRFAVFVENLRRAEERNAKEQGSAVFGVDQFSDLTPEEFRTTRLMNKALLARNKPRALSPAAEASYDVRGLPESFDWREHNAVTAVKNQEACGSCWAFSTAANVESVFAVKRGKLFSLSEQQIVDCAKDQFGCGGGWPIQAMADVEKMGGLELEKEYSYEGVDDKCRFNKSEVVVRIDNAVKLSSNEQKIAAYLVKHGGVSVAFNAEASIMGYNRGIVKLSHEQCDPKSPDHAVLLVGYGSENGVHFWIVKNSWGADWGEQGYFRIFRGGNTCGIADNAASAVVN